MAWKANEETFIAAMFPQEPLLGSARDDASDNERVAGTKNISWRRLIYSSFRNIFYMSKKGRPICVDGDLDESIKRSASDRLGDLILVPQVRAWTSPGVFRDMAKIMALPWLCPQLLAVKENFSWKISNLPPMEQWAKDQIKSKPSEAESTVRRKYFWKENIICSSFRNIFI